MSIEGVDYSFSRPAPWALAAAGKKFAVRYGGPGSDAKHLHADELTALRGAGVDVVANAEGTAGGYYSASAGKLWAQSALAHFSALGMPADRPVYFSVDFDADARDWPFIDEALRASALVLGAERVGVYGSYGVIEHCRSANTARWLWQTYAWSNGRQHPAAHLYQYRNGVSVGGADCDLNRALKDDYGQWGYQAPPPKEDPVEQKDYDAIAKAVWSYPLDVDVRPDTVNLQPAGGILRYTSYEHHYVMDRVDALLNRPNVSAAEIAAAVPAGIAQEVADLLAQRLQS